jgi:hypothetical protein
MLPGARFHPQPPKKK